MKRCIPLFLAVVMCMLVSCGANDAGIWDTALYTQDAELGSGGTEIEVLLTAGEKSITFTLHTDAETLGDVLLENGLAAGEQGQYGLYVKEVNGMRAESAGSGAYWSFTKAGEYMQTGVDGEIISDGGKYGIELIK